MRRLIEEALEAHDIHECATFADASERIEREAFDLVILDLSLPDGSGETLIDPLLQRNPNCYVVISSIHDESKRLIGALSRGAKGYLLKEQTESELIAALKGIPSGVPPLSATMTRRILDHLRRGRIENGDLADKAPAETQSAPPPPPRDWESLTQREAEILSLLARGFNRPDIAGMLNISKHTVATHVSNLYGKLNISSRSEAAIAARELGLI